MYLTKLLLCLLIIYGCDTLRTCDDCTFIQSCPKASKLATKYDNETKLKFKAALCDYDYPVGSRRRAPKVCCSDFSIQPRFGILDDMESKRNLLPENCGNLVEDHIVGGEIAKLREYPWMALIGYRSRVKSKVFRCGGSIINSRYILTAAHCVKNPAIYKVRVGEFDLRTDVDTQGEYPNIDYETHIEEINITEVIAHEDYDNMTFNNDIALLRLEKPIDFSHKNVAPICLPVTEELQNVNLDDKVVTVAGWGATETGRASPVLRKVDISVLKASTCRDYYERSNNNAMRNKLCAGELSKDSCKGDSGGPLMLRRDINKMEKVVQYGVVSFGPLLCGSQFPGVYTDVSKYMNWILENIKP